MKTQFKRFVRPGDPSFIVVCAVALIFLFGMLASSAQTGEYLYAFPWSTTNITLNPGLYNITAYGAQGGNANYDQSGGTGGLGAEMEGEFSFTTTTTLTLMVGEGAGGGYNFSGAGGGGGSFVFNGTTPLVVAGGGGGGGAEGLVEGNGGNGSNGNTGTGGSGGGGSGGKAGNIVNSSDGGGGGGGYAGNGTNGGSSAQFFSSGGGGGSYLGGGLAGAGYGGNGGYGGGSFIASSAVSVLAEVLGVASPDDSLNGEIIITAVPPSLGIMRSGNTVILTWPTNFTGFMLQCTTNFTSPAAWSTVSPAPAVVNGVDTVTNAVGGGQMFYRLAQ